MFSLATSWIPKSVTNEVAVFDPSPLSHTITHHLQPAVSANKMTNYGMKKTKTFYISDCLKISKECGIQTLVLWIRVKFKSLEYHRDKARVSKNVRDGEFFNNN